MASVAEGSNRRRGLYHAQWKGTPAWIEMFVNNIVEAFPPMLFRVPLFRDMVFAEVLYHEVGHHIHRTVRPEYQEREDVADKWRGVLWWSFFRRRYWSSGREKSGAADKKGGKQG